MICRPRRFWVKSYHAGWRKLVGLEHLLEERAFCSTWPRAISKEPFMAA